MRENHQFQAVMTFAIVKSAAIGLVLGYWLGYERWSSPVKAAAMASLGVYLIYNTWRRTSRAFWPDGLTPRTHSA